MDTLQTLAPLDHQSLGAHQTQLRGWVREAINGAVDLTPPYQRGEAWTRDQQRLLYRSFLTGIPVPAIILNDRTSTAWEINNGHCPLDDGKNIWAVIDGKQRLLAGIAWHTGDLDLPASWINPDFIATTRETADGPYVTIDDLTEKGRRIIEHRCLIPVAEAKVSTLAEEAAIFMLVNRGGTDMTTTDIARAERVAHTG